MRPEYIKDAFHRVGPQNRSTHPNTRGVVTGMPVANHIHTTVTNQIDSTVSHAPTNTKSQGLGDTVEKIAKATGLDKVAQVYTKVTGKDCGCAKRKAALNQAVPYS